MSLALWNGFQALLNILEPSRPGFWTPEELAAYLREAWTSENVAARKLRQETAQKHLPLWFHRMETALEKKGPADGKKFGMSACLVLATLKSRDHDTYMQAHNLSQAFRFAGSEVEIPWSTPRHRPRQAPSKHPVMSFRATPEVRAWLEAQAASQGVAVQAVVLNAVLAVMNVEPKNSKTAVS